MCGFAGLVTPSGSRVSDELLQRMHDRIVHRGPDDSGIEIRQQNGFGVAATRLAIIDLSSAGHQPMWNQDKSVLLVLNGEIYNFRSLRTQLEDQGHRFLSRTDTEVVLRAYEEWGDSFLDRLDGMFALVVADFRTSRVGEIPKILMARDRAGEKPLYYYWNRLSRCLVFASEIKAILEHPEIPREVSGEGLRSYLSLGYIPSPYSIYQDVWKVPPARRVVLTDSSDLQTSVYWTVEHSDELVGSTGKGALRASIERAVEQRLISDVPLGAFLSGGVDSTIVVGLMARMSSTRPRTFSAAFDVGPRSWKYNVDARAARSVADGFGADHTELTIPTPSDLTTLLRKTTFHADEPHANPTLVTTYLLAEAVKKSGTTVILTGDGSDELFGGYDRYRLDRYVDWFRRVPAPMRRRLATALGSKVPNIRAANEKAELSPAGAERYLSWWWVFDSEWQRRVLSQEWQKNDDSLRNVVEAAIGEAPHSAMAQDVMGFVDWRLWVADESNMRADKMTMAHGLETRAPFEDHRVVEAAFGIGFGEKVGFPTFTSKKLLKAEFSDLLPEMVRRRPKWGWFSPAYYWLNDKLWTEASALIRGLPDTGIFSSDVERLLDVHPTQQLTKVWALMTFALWHQEFMSGS